MFWYRKRGERLYDDESFYVGWFPQHIARAFLEVHYEGPDHTAWLSVEEAIAAFVERWGGLDDASIQRALQHAQGVDKLVAIFAFGHRGLPEDQALLLPLLESPDQLERCAAACCLALRRDERAIPVLLDMLVHDPPSTEAGRSEPSADPWYYTWWGQITSLLATWGPPSVVPVLRQAFLMLWEWEQQGRRNAPEYWYQDALLYALGRRGALGALSGIALPWPHLRLALVYLALGYTRADERFDKLHTAMLLERSLKQEVAGVLQAHFGLSVQESQECVSHYGGDYEDRFDALYAVEPEAEGETETGEQN